jgi:hypothetical protein
VAQKNGSYTEPLGLLRSCICHLVPPSLGVTCAATSAQCLGPCSYKNNSLLDQLGFWLRSPSTSFKLQPILSELDTKFLYSVRSSWVVQKHHRNGVQQLIFYASCNIRVSRWFSVHSQMSLSLASSCMFFVRFDLTCVFIFLSHICLFLPSNFLLLFPSFPSSFIHCYSFFVSFPLSK